MEDAVEIVVNDRMQQGYVYWRTAPMGEAFDPAFQPELTPAEMSVHDTNKRWAQAMGRRRA